MHPLFDTTRPLSGGSIDLHQLFTKSPFLGILGSKGSSAFAIRGWVLEGVAGLGAPYRGKHGGHGRTLGAIP
jgi:hypothetical protein